MLKISFIAIALTLAVVNTKTKNTLPAPEQATTTATNTRTQFAAHLSELIDADIVYEPSYRNIEFPCGDVPANIGVCSDVVIRAFKKIGVCLQEDVYNYRKANGQTTDTNIDHRRVRNLGPYFASLGWEIPAVNDRSNQAYYQPGDIIWWKLSGNIDHIGIVTTGGRVLHNIGYGQVADVKPMAYTVHKVYRMND